MTNAAKEAGEEIDEQKHHEEIVFLLQLIAGLPDASGQEAKNIVVTKQQCALHKDLFVALFTHDAKHGMHMDDSPNDYMRGDEL
jgi:hypothetical protein